MVPNYITNDFLERFLSSAMAEDVGDGDHSTVASILDTGVSQAKLLVKDRGILAGVLMAEKIFHFFDPSLKIEVYIEDGSDVKEGDIGFSVKGPARSILTTERLVLNCMQRMSGIASKTKYLTSLVNGTGVTLLDTRKTTPNFRLVEKWAVLIGGGKNHRLGLFDMIMLKDNHIDMAGGIEEAILRTKDYLRATNRKLKIEIETRNLEEVTKVKQVGGVDIIMLDNMPLEELREAVRIIDGEFKTEASGNVTEKSIRDIAACGVDFISVGALTHSYKCMDLSLKAY